MHVCSEFYLSMSIEYKPFRFIPGLDQQGPQEFWLYTNEGELFLLSWNVEQLEHGCRVNWTLLKPDTYPNWSNLDSVTPNRSWEASTGSSALIYLQRVVWICNLSIRITRQLGSDHDNYIDKRKLILVNQKDGLDGHWGKYIKKV